jgi:hypothetical protein
MNKKIITLFLIVVIISAGVITIYNLYRQGQKKELEKDINSLASSSASQK